MTIFSSVEVTSTRPENEPVKVVNEAIRVAKALGQGIWLTWSDGRKAFIMGDEDPAGIVDWYWRERKPRG